MPLTAPRPLRSLILLVCAALLAACQSLPRPSGFTAEQIAVLTSEGFTAGDPDWSLSLSERLLFPFDESQVPPDQQTRIETLAHRLLSVGIDTARVEGHTDSIGAESYNLALSQARAEAVAAPLRAGGMRLTPDQVIGRGEALPLSSNETAEGRRDNRRVVIIVTP